MRRTLIAGLAFCGVLVIGGCLHAPMPWSPDGKWIAYTVEVRPIEATLRPGWLFDSATDLVGLPSKSATSRPSSYRIWATRGDSGESVLLEESPTPLTAPGWRPDGLAVAFGRVVADPDGKARFEVVVQEGPTRRRILSSRPIPEVGVEASRLPGQSIVWSPDGRYLAVPQLHPLGLAILRSDNGRQINTIPEGFLPSWAPDADRLAFFVRGTGDTLNFLDSPISQPRQLVEIGQGCQAPAWTRDGLSVVIVARKSVPRGGEAAGQVAEILRVRVDTGVAETVRVPMNDAVLGQDRASEGVSIAFDSAGDNLFSTTVAGGSPQEITWYRPRENSVYKKFSLIDFTAPMGSLSISPDGRTLAARVGTLDRLTPPALCDLDSNDLRSRLVAPDDPSRVEWVATLVKSARTILSSLPTTSADPKAPSGNRLDRPTLLPILGEFEANSEQTFRLRRIGKLGRPLCDRPSTAPPAEPGVVAVLDEARLFFDYLTGNYASALTSLELLESRTDSPDRRLKLLSVRAQIFLAQGNVDRAERTIGYLREIAPRPPRQIEWTGLHYRVIGGESIDHLAWPDYLAWRASAVRSILHDEAALELPKPPVLRAGPFGFLPPPNIQVIPDRPFFNEGDAPLVPNIRVVPQNRPRMQGRDPSEIIPR